MNASFTASGESNSRVVPIKEEASVMRGFLSTPVYPAIFTMAADIVLMAFFFGLFYILRTGQNLVVLFEGERIAQFVVFALSIIAVVALMGGYRVRQIYRRLNFAAEFFLAVGVGTLLGIFIIYAILSRDAAFTSESRAAFLLGAVCYSIPSVLIRIGIINLYARESATRPYLLMGWQTDIEGFMASYEKMGLTNPLYPVILSEKDAGEKGLKVIQNEALIKSCDAVIICSDASSIGSKLLGGLMHLHAHNVTVFTMDSFYSYMWRQVPLVDINLSWGIELSPRLSNKRAYFYVKTIFDWIVSALILLLSLPLMILAALAIFLESGRPIFFCQKRVGLGQKVFLLYKFRTMKNRPDVDTDDPYARKDDPRITRVGAVLRRLRLDELPQLFNVFLGDMSLIGPRAEWVRLVEEYEKKIPCYHLRHMVKPGITGWAQSNYPYGENLEDAYEKLKYDLYYIKNYSLILDIEIFLKTILAVLSAKGK